MKFQSAIFKRLAVINDQNLNFTNFLKAHSPQEQRAKPGAAEVSAGVQARLQGVRLSLSLE